jgi:hypothetical protein
LLIRKSLSLDDDDDDYEREKGKEYEEKREQWSSNRGESLAGKIVIASSGGDLHSRQQHANDHLRERPP